MSGKTHLESKDCDDPHGSGHYFTKHLCDKALFHPASFTTGQVKTFGVRLEEVVGGICILGPIVITI